MDDNYSQLSDEELNKLISRLLAIRAFRQVRLDQLQPPINHVPCLSLGYGIQGNPAGKAILTSLYQCLATDDERDAMLSFLMEYHSVIEWVIKFNRNPNGNGVSYHNTRHLIGVAYLAYVLSDNYHTTVLAAFIHDFRYRNESKDSSNIHSSLFNAISNGFFNINGSRNKVDEEEIIATVKATEYDFAHPFPEKTHPQDQIIRDADQLYATVFFDEDVYRGLEAEVGPKVNCTGKAFLERNIEYVKNNRFYTDRAREMFNKYLPRCLEQHQTILSSLYPTTGRRVYQVWSEGYNTNGLSAGATLRGEAEADSFEEACRLVFLTLVDSRYFDADRLRYWGCRLFDNEADARKSFG